MLIIDKVTVTTAKQIPDNDVCFAHNVCTAITKHELFDVVKNRAMAIAKELDLQTQGRSQAGVEMMEGQEGFPCADIRSYGKIMDQVFCTEEV